MDLRQRILDAYLTREESWGELAKRFRVGVATVDRLIGRWKRTGSLAPKRPGPRPFFRIPDSQLGKVKRLLDAAPDSTTQEIAEASPHLNQMSPKASRKTACSRTSCANRSTNGRSRSSLMRGMA
ncbi:helix-turn-helix domain-containing protein, partial [Corallococcus exiguus]